MKHKASLLIMRIYTCVLMLYKGRRSRTHPVYSLFKFQIKFMQPRPQGHLCGRGEEIGGPGKGCKNLQN